MSDVNQAVLTMGLLLLLANATFHPLDRRANWQMGGQGIALPDRACCCGSMPDVVATTLAAVGRLLP